MTGASAVTASSTRPPSPDAASPRLRHERLRRPHPRRGARRAGDDGYDAVALTLGHPHLDPFAADADERAARLRERLDAAGLARRRRDRHPVPARPVRKHRPTLVDEDAEPRMRFLRRAIELAAILDADCVSLWSGVAAGRRRAATTAGAGSATRMREHGRVRRRSRRAARARARAGHARRDRRRRAAAARGPGLARRARHHRRPRALRRRRARRRRRRAARRRALLVQRAGRRHAAHAHEHLPFGEGGSTCRRARTLPTSATAGSPPSSCPGTRTTPRGSRRGAMPAPSTTRWREPMTNQSDHRPPVAREVTARPAASPRVRGRRPRGGAGPDRPGADPLGVAPRHRRRRRPGGARRRAARRAATGRIGRGSLATCTATATTPSAAGCCAA